MPSPPGAGSDACPRHPTARLGAVPSRGSVYAQKREPWTLVPWTLLSTYSEHRPRADAPVLRKPGGEIRR